jgi:long-chain acyl-CoA synthetase
VGAGSLSLRQKKEYDALLGNTRIVNTWGSSETGGAIFLDLHEAAGADRGQEDREGGRVTSIGKPLGGVQIRVLDGEGRPMEHTDRAHPGRLALRGDFVMSGYWNRPGQTRDALRDGWLVTNDLVYLDGEGYVYMLGRADDIINVGGEKVSPIEVENTAGQYEGIRECACISADDPDGVLGQIPVLFIVPDFGYDKDAFTRFLAARLEKYKIPKEIITLDAIPRNRMQKIDRRSLKNLYDDRDKLDLINPVIQAILSRRSIRSFTDREIGADVLEMILKAGYNAPRGHNLQS